MELDDLKSAWQTLDRRLEQQNALQLHTLRGGKIDQLRGSLRPLVWGQLAQILFGALMLVLGVACWTRNSDVPALFGAGLSLHVYGVAAIIFAGVTLGRISRIDYAAPVLAIQKQLVQLRRTYILNGLCAGLPWWLLWIIAPMALLGLAGVDITSHAPEFVWISLAVGAAGLLATLWSLRWAQDPRRPRLAGLVDASMTGASLRKARCFLDEIAQFERT